MTRRADLTAVVVSYRSASLLPDWLSTLHAGAPELQIETVVVENESTPEEWSAVQSVPGFDRRLFLPGNPGYAGGLNAGLAEAGAPVFLLSNPDVLFEPGSLSRLVRTAHEVHGAVGPVLHFDPGGRWLLPPPEHETPAGELTRLLAPHSESLRRIRRRREAEWIERVRTATHPIELSSLPGAIWVVTASAWERAGKLDEMFPLYFEETDWFSRAAARGVPIRLEPRAKVRHLFDRSGPGSAESRRRYGVSEQLYWRRYGGPAFNALRGILGRLPRFSGGREKSFDPLVDLSLPIDPPSGWNFSSDWILSPSPDLVPAVHARVDCPLTGLDEIRRLLPEGRWFLARGSIDGDAQPVGYFDSPGAGIPDGQTTS